jgi:hypothetical protein
MAIRLYDKESKKSLGEITPQQLEVLRDMLEEEDSEDRDYFVSPEVLDYLEENGADATLIKMLRDAVGDGEGIDVEWRQE